MNFKRTYVTLFFTLCLTANLRAQTDVSLIQKAHEYYQQGNFEEAGKLYESLLKDHPDSPELHYNLGNTYFKLKQLGKAILNYEKARQIEPRDNAINENLSYVQGLIEYKVEDKRNWYLIQWDRLLGRFTCTEFFALTLILYTFSMVFLTLRFFPKREYKFLKLSGPLFFLFLFSLAPLLSKSWEGRFQRSAVVASSKAEVRYGPSQRDKVAFRLVEGLKVQVQEERDDWYLVGLVNGESGWCEKKNLELV